MRERQYRDPLLKGPLASVTDSLQRVDLLFNSKRQDLVKRLREGSRAWDKRRQSFLDNGKSFTGQQMSWRPRKRQKDSSNVQSTDVHGFMRDCDFTEPNVGGLPAFLRNPEGISLVSLSGKWTQTFS